MILLHSTIAVSLVQAPAPALSRTAVPQLAAKPVPARQAGRIFCHAHPESIVEADAPEYRLMLRRSGRRGQTSPVPRVDSSYLLRDHRAGRGLVLAAEADTRTRYRGRHLRRIRSQRARPAR